METSDFNCIIMNDFTVHSCLQFRILDKHTAPIAIQIVSNVLVLIHSDTRFGSVHATSKFKPSSKKVVGHAHALPDLHNRHFSSEQDIAYYSKCTLQKQTAHTEAGYQEKKKNQDRLRLPSKQPNCIVFPHRILLAKSSGKG